MVPTGGGTSGGERWGKARNLGHAACEATRVAVYEPRRRGEDVLYQVLDRHLADFLDQAEASGREVQLRVRRELNAYLACGDPSEGFVLWRCAHCPGFRVVAFRCKGRGFCPTCGGGRMNRLAAHPTARTPGSGVPARRSA
jgi:hypothetical protein